MRESENGLSRVWVSGQHCSRRRLKECASDAQVHQRDDAALVLYTRYGDEKPVSSSPAAHCRRPFALTGAAKQSSTAMAVWTVRRHKRHQGLSAVSAESDCFAVPESPGRQKPGRPKCRGLMEVPKPTRMRRLRRSVSMTPCIQRLHRIR